MPTYEYVCEDNGQVVTVRHGMNVVIRNWGELCFAAQVPMGDTDFEAPVRKKLGAPGIAVPRVWPGLRDGRFALGLVPAAAKAPLPGVLAHQYFGHADGSMLVLYAWLRLEAGLAPDVAFEEAMKRATGVRRADVRDLLPTPAVA